MKNVKKLLIFITISTFIYASGTRVNALGGAGFWAEDYANITAFPASVNNHNVAWTDGNDFTSVWNANGTTWGFAGGSGDDMANMWWGNGTYGLNVGLGMTPEKKMADGDAMDANAETAINVGFGMPLAGMDFGLTYGMGCDGCGGGDVGINLRRPQNIWLFENVLIDFGMLMEEKTNNVVKTASNMAIGAHLYKNTAYDSGINSLFAVGFTFVDKGKYDWDMDVATAETDPDAAMGIVWNFAVESAMTDWATLRIGYSHNYDFANGGTDSSDSMTCGDGEDSWCGDQVGGLVVGLGFNYGSFQLDMNVGDYESLVTNPGRYVAGRNETLGANWTISYNW